MGDFVEDLVVAPAAAEFRHRRCGWQRGPSVCLADGGLWFLPKINLALLASVPTLQDDLSKAFDIAADVQREHDGSRRHAIGLTYYHAHMANIGVRLL